MEANYFLTNFVNSKIEGNSINFESEISPHVLLIPIISKIAIEQKKKVIIISRGETYNHFMLTFQKLVVLKRD